MVPASLVKAARRTVGFEPRGLDANQAGAGLLQGVFDPSEELASDAASPTSSADDHPVKIEAPFGHRCRAEAGKPRARASASSKRTNRYSSESGWAESCIHQLERDLASSGLNSGVPAMRSSELLPMMRREVPEHCLPLFCDGAHT